MSLRERDLKRFITLASLTLFVSLTLGVGLLAIAKQPDTGTKVTDENAVEVPVILEMFALPAIQKDLDLDVHQIEKLSTLDDSLERLPFAARDGEARKAVAATLNREQLKRLNQIMLRGLGVRAFGVPDVVGKLELTADQKSKVAAIRNNLKSHLQPFQAEIDSNGSPKNYSEAMDLAKDTDAFYEDAYQHVLNVLTSSQRNVFDELIGPTVKPVRAHDGE